MIKTSFGKLNEHGTKAVYLTDENGERVFGFWYDSSTDNPHDLKPKQAVLSVIQNAGFKDLREYFNYKLSWKEEIEQ